MFYDKKIKYLNYIVGGERIKGCGFVKIEVRENNLNLEISISGLPPSLYSYADVCLCAGEASYPLGQTCIENGGGNFRLCNCAVSEISPMGVAYDDWKGICILPDDECEISAYWEENPVCCLERVEISKELATEGVESRMLGEARTEMPQMLKPKVLSPEVPEVSGTMSPEMSEETDVAEAEKWESREERKTQPEQLRMAEDKWEQISGIYPHIKPFRDKREYLSIRPADFVLFSTESYKAVNNSFLLHGYYNYRHLILARTVKKGAVSYYVGTPGNFFQREKQVAIMFGFTGFECAKDPAREGDFGYYLMEVQL